MLDPHAYSGLQVATDASNLGFVAVLSLPSCLRYPGCIVDRFCQWVSEPPGLGFGVDVVVPACMASSLIIPTSLKRLWRCLSASTSGRRESGSTELRLELPQAPSPRSWKGWSDFLKPLSVSERGKLPAAGSHKAHR